MGARHYLDHAATTAVRPEVAARYAEELTRLGNPSSLHTAGREARRRLEEAREQLAAALGARPGEVVFTSGGTEADNLAVKGAWWARREDRDALAVSAVEHHAVLEAAAWLAAHEGAQVDRLPVGADGVLDLGAAENLLARRAGRVALVSVMWANNETGVLQPVPDVVELARRHGAAVHTDAVQAVGHVPVDFAPGGPDALTLSGHKLGAPVGTGALLARRELALVPVEHGGGQERGVRSGTIAVAGARALALAVELAVAEVADEGRRLRALRDRLTTGVLAAVPGARLTGPPPGPGPDPRLPGTVHLTVDGADADALLLGLDLAGVAASSGSACQAGVQEASHVLLAMGRDEDTARSALRLSLGRTSTDADVDAVLAALPTVVDGARRAHEVRTRRRGAATARVTAGSPAAGPAAARAEL
ncbi:cysteine desulfurase family protein [Georgenia muralis]